MSGVLILAFGLWQSFRAFLRRANATETAVSIAVLCFAVMPFRYDVHTIYVRHTSIAVLCALAAMYLYNSFRHWHRPVRDGLLIAGVGAGGLALIWSSASSAGAVRSVDLTSPLRGGSFYTVQGGNNPIVNNHRLGRARIPAQAFALDLTMLSRAGRRSSLVGPSDDLSTYHIFGQPVHARCRGRVVRAVSGFADSRVPNRRAPAGNYVAIECEDDITVTLAHLRSDLRVETNDVVREGEIVGMVGSTGYTSEPHLHIHAVEGIQSDERVILFTGTAVLTHIGGTVLYKNRVLEEGS